MKQMDMDMDMDNKASFETSNANRPVPHPAEQAGARFSAAPETPAAGRLAELSSAPKWSHLPASGELWDLYRQEPCVDAENALIECYLPLVSSILNRVTATLPAEVDREDLYSAGLLGLLTALRKFNPATGVPFDSYARQRIRGAMLDEIRRMDWVPRAIRTKAKHFQQVSHRLEQQLGRSPNDVEAAVALGMDMADYAKFTDEIRPAQFIRLDAAAENDSETDKTLGEFFAGPAEINPFDQASSAELQTVILEKLEQMPEMQRQVLRLYYIEGMYMHEIAAVLKLTEGRICQIQSQAIQTLRDYLKRFEKGLENAARFMKSPMVRANAF